MQLADCSTQQDHRWPGNSDRRSMSSFVEPAAAAGWQTGCWNGQRSVTSADSMPQGMMVPDRGYTYTSAELSNKWSVAWQVANEVLVELASSARTFCSCDDTSRGVLNYLQFVQQLATDTKQDAVAVVESTANKLPSYLCDCNERTSDSLLGLEPRASLLEIQRILARNLELVNYGQYHQLGHLSNF